MFINRELHQRGLLTVQETGHGQLLDAGASRAFAVADHQVAHVYVRDAADLEPTRALLAGMEGVAQVLRARAAGRDWIVPAEVRVDAFRAWQKQHLPRHKPETRIIGSWNYRKL